MRVFLLLLFLVALAQPLFAAPTKPKQAPHPFSVHDMLDLDRVGAPVLSPSKTRALFTRWTYDFDSNRSAQSIWMVDLTASNSTAITTSPYGSSDFSPFWIDDSTIGFLSASRSPSGTAQIFVAKIGSGATPSQLTNYPLGLENVKLFSTSTTRMLGFTTRVYASLSMEETKQLDDEKAKDPSDSMVYDRLYFRHWDTYSDHKFSHLFVTPLITTSDGGYAVGATPIDLLFGLELETPVLPFGGPTDFEFSPDGTEAAFVALKPGYDQAWSTDTNIYLVNVSGVAQPWAITEFNLGNDAYPVYSPDGSKIAYLAMKTPKYEADRRQVMIYDRTLRTHVSISAEWDRSPTSLVWSSDSTLLYLTVPDNARENIYSIKVSNGQYTPLVRGGYFSGLSVTSRGLVTAKNSQLGPNEIYTLESGVLTQRTFVNKDKLANILTSQPEEFIFTGALNDPVHGWIIKPVGFEQGKKYPVAFLVHGGPQSAWMDNFSTRWNPQAWAGAGFVVVAIDFHGSTSYGQAFTDAINGEWGSHPYEDLMTGLDYVIDTYSYVDGNRVTALGASYGGFMMNWFNGNTDRFSCLVNHCGIFDTQAMYYSTEELFFVEYDLRGTEYENRDLYEKWNPKNLVSNWKTPALIIHGELDYRVPFTQGISAFQALYRQGIKTRFLVLPSENHWVLRPANLVRWYDEVLGWISDCTAV